MTAKITPELHQISSRTVLHTLKEVNILLRRPRSTSFCSNITDNYYAGDTQGITNGDWFVLLMNEYFCLWWSYLDIPCFSMLLGRRWVLISSRENCLQKTTLIRHCKDYWGILCWGKIVSTLVVHFIRKNQLVTSGMRRNYQKTLDELHQRHQYTIYAIPMHRRHVVRIAWNTQDIELVISFLCWSLNIWYSTFLLDYHC